MKRKEATTPLTKAKKSKSAVKEKRVSATAHLIQWDPKADDFVGDRGRLRAKIYDNYDDLGKEWIDATWNSMTEWCDLRPEYISGVKDCWMFVLGWYRRDARQTGSGM